jgi:AmmeMemoRadiSam system protein B
VPPPRGVPLVVIVPHHEPAASMIRAALAAAVSARTTPPARVILLAPDHRHVARRPAMTSLGDWTTDSGRVTVDRGAVLDITHRTALSARQPAVHDEHGLGVVMPYLSELLPGTPVIPIAVRSDANGAEVRGLASALAPWATDALIVASVDFSHGLDLRAAGEADRETLAALRRLDAGAFLDWGSEHLDAAGALPVALALARASGADRFELVARSNSHRLGGPPTDVTTYITGFVSKDPRSAASARRAAPSP